MRDLLVLFVHSIVTIGPTGKTGWPSCRHRPIRAHSPSNPHPESRPEASSQPACFRSDHRRFMHPAHAPFSRAAMWHCPKTIDSAVFPSPPDETKVSHAERGRRTGPKGPAKELIDAVVEMKGNSGVVVGREDRTGPRCEARKD